MKKFIERLKRMNAGVIMGIIFTLYSVFYFVQSFAYPYHNRFGTGPGFFPRWVAILSILAGLAYIGFSLFRDKFIVGDVFPQKKELVNVITVVIAIAVYLLIINYTGFVIASVLLMFSIFIRSYPWWKALFYAVIASVIVFFIFRLGFHVPIPVNSFGF